MTEKITKSGKKKKLCDNCFMKIKGQSVLYHPPHYPILQFCSDECCRLWKKEEFD